MRLSGALARPMAYVCVAALAGAVVLAGNASTRLVGVSARSDDSGQTVLIEATEPVAYAVSQPDPLTVVVDLRGVSIDGAVNRVSEAPAGPVRSIRVEESEATDGEAVARVRLALAEPTPHRVRSARNTIRVEFPDAPSRAPVAGPPTAPSSDPATILRHGPTRAQAPAAARPAIINAATNAAIDPMSALKTVSGGRVVTPARTRQAQASGSQPPPVTAKQASQAPTRYTGHPVTLDFQDADLRAVLRTFAEISTLNMVIDPAVQGTVDVVLTEVPWDQALDIILRGAKLGYTVDGTVVRIAPLSVLADEETARRKLAEEQALAGELSVTTRGLSYAKAASLAPLVTRASLSARGEIQVDERTNTLIIRDLPANLAQADQLLTELDRPEPQVEIEARIVQTTRDFARALGVHWGFSGNVSQEIGNTTGLAFPNRGVLEGRTTLQQGTPEEPPRSAVGIALSSINGAFNLDATLTALERAGKGRILSTPRVTTQNNQPAEMTQGTQIPIQTIANNTVTVQFKDAALSLKVTPQITSANTVIMRIELENAAPDYTRSVNFIPPIDTQRAITQVQVTDGATTVIGGIFISNEQASNDRTPGLHRIPLLGWLFRSESLTDKSRELLIFITPRILRG